MRKEEKNIEDGGAIRYIRFGAEITRIRGFGLSELEAEKLVSDMYWLSRLPVDAVI